MFQMLGVFAEFERSLIQQRVRAGIARARERGATFGRPCISSVREDEIRRLLETGMGIRTVARLVGLKGGDLGLGQQDAIPGLRRGRLCATLASRALRRCLIDVRSWRCHRQRTPAGEIDSPCRLSIPETHPNLDPGWLFDRHRDYCLLDFRGSAVL
jgi:hypothetical protein